GHALGVDRHGFAGPRVAPDARVALTRRECAETAQLNTPAGRELIGDRIENGAHHAFDLTLRELGKIGAQLLHQLGTDHRQPRCGFVLDALWTGPLLPQTRRAAWEPRCQETLRHARQK